MKVHLYIATSIDGFIAGPRGELEWLEDPGFAIEGEDFGYAAFIEKIDYLMMGRNTFEKVSSMDKWPYYGIKVIVLSHYSYDLPKALQDAVEFLSLAPRQLYDLLESRGAQNVYVDGGVTARSFLEEGLIDEMTITYIPKMIGRGIPLFAQGAAKTEWKLDTSRAYPNSFVQNRYVK